MVFTIRSNAAGWFWTTWQIIYDAKTVIIRHRITPGEQKLNKYLIDSYGLDLKAACLYLLANGKVQKNKDKDIIFLFPKKSDDRLAALITYGNGELKGCNLLKDALFRDK